MKILWLSDFKTSDHTGGAEMTNDAILEAAPEDVVINHLHLHLLSPETIQHFKPDFLVMDSMTRLTNPQTILDTIQTIPFATLEYDYNKVSKTRHLMYLGDMFLTEEDGWCQFYKTFWANPNRKMSFFMSEKQMQIHLSKFEEAHLAIDPSTCMVLSSVFSKDSLRFIEKLLQHAEKRGCLLYTSPSPRDRS